MAKLTAYGSKPLIKWYRKDYPSVKFCLRSDRKILWKLGESWSIRSNLKASLSLDEAVEKIKTDPNAIVIKQNEMAIMVRWVKVAGDRYMLQYYHNGSWFYAAQFVSYSVDPITEPIWQTIAKLIEEKQQ